MRRLLILVCAIVLVDTMLYAALVPLLPGYVDEFGLSKTGAGILVATYAAGVLVGALPAGLAAARFGPRRAALAGLALIAAASVGFAFAGDEWTLGGARLVQGFGSALSWSGGLAWLVAVVPRERRGELLGTALGAAIFGALLGPVVGGIASVIGARPAFVGVGVLTAVLAVWAARTNGVPPERASLAALAPAFREPRFTGGLWLMFLPAVLFGVLAVLVPLELAAHGWSAAAIGAVFLSSAAVEALTAPSVGRLSDRIGGITPIRVALVASALVSLALSLADTTAVVAALVVFAGVSYAALFAPGMSYLAEGADRAALPQSVGFGLMNAAWATGALAGPAAGGAVGEAAGDVFAYAAGGVLVVLTLAAVRPRRQGVVTRAARVPDRP